MRKIFSLCMLQLFIFFGMANAQGDEVIGKRISDFSLRNTDGKKISLSDYPDAKGCIIVFTCNHCPFAKLYYKRFNALSKKYASKHIPFLAINPMDSLMYQEEGWKEMQELARKKKFSFPYLQDAQQTAAREFGATHTPQAYVLWKTEDGQWTIQYAGAVDDNGAEPKKVEANYLSDAADDLLNGVPVRQAKTSAIGCKIYYRK